MQITKATGNYMSQVIFWYCVRTDRNERIEGYGGTKRVYMVPMIEKPCSIQQYDRVHTDA